MSYSGSIVDGKTDMHKFFQKSRSKKGGMDQVQDSGFTNIRRHRIAFSRHDNLVRRILCTPL